MSDCNNKLNGKHLQNGKKKKKRGKAFLAPSTGQDIEFAKNGGFVVVDSASAVEKKQKQLKRADEPTKVPELKEEEKTTGAVIN